MYDNSGRAVLQGDLRSGCASVLQPLATSAPAAPQRCERYAGSSLKVGTVPAYIFARCNVIDRTALRIKNTFVEACALPGQPLQQLQATSIQHGQQLRRRRRLGTKLPKKKSYASKMGAMPSAHARAWPTARP